MSSKKQFLSFLLAVSSIFAAEAKPSSDPIITAIGSDGLTFLYFQDNHKHTLPLLSLKCGEAKALGNPSVVKVEYDMVTGKRRHCSNSYEEYKYLLADNDTLLIRYFDDGIAWKKKGASQIAFIDPLHTWMQDWTDCYEQFFPKDAEMTPGKRIGYPALVEYKNGIFGLLTESGITPEEAGVSMHALGGNAFDLIPDGPENGGWQTFIVGSLSDIVESTLVMDNSAPNKLGDVSWVHPGVAAWVYWAYNHGSNDYNIIKKYVDLAAELKLPYVLIDAEWDEMKDGKTIEDAVAYAVSKGVKPMIWYNSSVGWVNGAPGPKFRLNTPEGREKEFAWCEKIGVTGVKIDFFSGDTNLNMKFMSELLDDAARHHLTVNFHGAPLPRGWQRTYPNLVSTEAVYGAEWYNNLPVLTNKAACHNATLPFTRNVIGSMDYTPCAFTDSQHPHITTHAHELALTSLFESGIQHLADRPESFLAQPQEVKDFLSTLPAAWDDTILLGGYPGEYVALARKSGDKWWISIINGTDSPLKIKDLDYSRLNLPKKYKAQLFEDADINEASKAEAKGISNENSKWKIRTSKKLPSKVSLQPRGGLVMVISPK